MNLVVDQGNSSAKIALFDAGEMIYFQKYEKFTLDDARSLHDKYNYTKAIRSSVIGEDEALSSLRKTYAKTVKKVSEDTAALNFNTAISQMMIFINEAAKLDTLPQSVWTDFVKILSPYAPHLGEELWQKLGNSNTIAYEPWPTWNEDWTRDAQKEIVVMVNGKLRAKFQAAADADDATLQELAYATDGAKKFLDGKTVVKTVVVPGKLVNIVVK